MDEGDEMAGLDHRSPKGKLIKLLEQKIKKPEIDDSLGEVLDQFSQLNNDQSTYLEHGIFHMSFAEDALLLQSCGQLYAKRVDKLWDELLQFHTRMVSYDGSTAKYCTDSDKREARNKEIAKLEERLNRGKRKKIVLARPEEEAAPVNGLALFDIEQECVDELFDNVTFPFPEDDPACEEEPETPFDFDFEAIDEWRAINDIDEEEKRRCYYSTFVAHYYRLRFRFKHFPTPNSSAIIYDWTDPEEYNTREKKLISCNHVRLMFFENDRCLLPDEHFIVAKLRCAYVLKKKWFIKNKVDPTAPYETYKESWEKYQQEFFADEQRKIQNMPQRTSAELLRFYKALARKEELAREQVEKLKEMGVENLPGVTFDNVIVAPTAEGYTGIFNSYTPEEFLNNPDEKPPVKEANVSAKAIAPAVCEGDHEAELSELLEDPLSQNADTATDKPRSDSGYFDGTFGDDDSDHEANHGSAANGTETSFEFDNETNKNTEEAAVQDSREPPETTISQSNTEIECSTIETSKFSDLTIELTNLSKYDIAQLRNISVDRAAMNRSIKEFTKQGSSDPDSLYQALENSYFEQTDDMTSIVYDKANSDVDVPCHGDFIIFLGYFDKENEIDAMEFKKAELKSRKRKLVVTDVGEPWPKRKTLSKQQVEKLKRSRIVPVNEQKWESFFSINYQAESGEGDIKRVEYESDSEEESEDEDISNHEDQASSECETTHTDLKIHVSDYSIENGAKENNSDPERPELSQDSGVEVSRSLNTSVEDSPSQPLAEENSTSNQVTPTSATPGCPDLRNGAIYPDLRDGTCSEDTLPDVFEIEEEPRKLTAAEEEAEKTRARVEEWCTYITAKLKKVEEKDFNIHEYGTKIINNMDINETKPFGSFVRGKSSAEVVRFFTSSLQLASTLNVEICGAQKGKLSNDTFQLKLLSKERYHEHLQNYQAPSEENLPNKLEKIKEIRMQNKKSQSLKRKAPQPKEQQSSTRKNSSKTSVPSQTPKKSKILKYNMLKGSDQDSVPIGASTSEEDLRYMQPSTSSQADLMDQQDVLDSAIFEIHGPSRISVDSGFMPSCDEDFLEQFEQLQHMSENCSSTVNTPTIIG
ncbi:uncharacterized protein LOC109546262 isoform X1 [Dendroctonus ponderosae]|uniref:uncharacterized protein LOC109546262 isoform X1 n=1 Tax=Dendroctonus ponderosae TaxID=77166 RepID=UPI0020353666|nr:uncharacterized protein LOC109546262 isoform X1 [Dendroctonus ponderosae]XP_048522886.1 uncharacterized protein LOC109546262 isoform X1 [Dendroctonus ponderosae]XP_048522892.1 uncharacterized protein LOC109546262 isoform X1 [Dendroctonus ponderosae]KAH1027696.1 hypothetical protein HUJ05_001156 [Dendroctonus ponderosae]KAH1027697.1 hypothetical protein HUJ05_001156 [Dendroctonus ponderosae]KAH1027698.1 hypothetical protein HUJ05_001156 [Dendroctonus ponderosae]KAH1027699.1 hypothetical pro